jgi:hypothetical protein
VFKRDGGQSERQRETARETETGETEIGALEVFYTEGGKGFGVRAGRDLQAGSLICEYIGEQLDSKQFAKRRKAASSKIYLLKADQMVIDASRRGNISRFVNHSCSPCAKVQLWTVPTTDGLSVRTAVGIVAKHFIQMR